MADTNIEWTDRVWNPIRGCSKVSAGCARCYAEVMAARFAKQWGTPEIVRPDGGWSGVLSLVESKLTEPLRWRAPQKVFVNSMSDLFHEKVPDEWIDRVFAVMALSPQHTFQVLTKRPGRALNWASDETILPSRRERVTAAMHAIGREIEATWTDAALRRSSYSRTWDEIDRGENEWPLPNVWLGVSVEDQATADARIPLLLQTPAAVRFVSYEPALAGVDFRAYLGGHHEPGRDGVPCARGDRHVHDGRGRAHLASQGVDEGQPERLGASARPSRAATRGREHVGAAPGVHGDDVPARDVRREGRAVDGSRAPSDLDDGERPDDRARAGDQPQERQRPRQQAEQSGGRDGVAERDARDSRTGREAEVVAGREERRGEADGRAGRGDPSARGAQVDAAVEDRGDVQRRPADGVEHRDGTHLEARRGLSWIIVGGESGPRARPMSIECVEGVDVQTRAAGVALFVKQDSGPKPGRQGRISAEAWARKEFPNAVR